MHDAGSLLGFHAVEDVGCVPHYAVSHGAAAHSGANGQAYEETYCAAD
jgi:hypothetical protein